MATTRSLCRLALQIGFLFLIFRLGQWGVARFHPPLPGVLGSMLGPWFLSRIHIHDPVARGLAVGTVAHGQGTAMMLQEGETQGALSGVAMALSAVFVSIIAPFAIPWILTLGR